MQDEPFNVPATGVVEYQMFVVDPGWKEDKWIQRHRSRGRATRRSSITSCCSCCRPTANSRRAWAMATISWRPMLPALRPEPLTPGLARRVPAGSKLIFQMHYTPNGSPQVDRSYCGFVFTDPKTVKQEVRVNSAVNFVFQIPAGADNFGVNSRYIFRQDTKLLTLMPHMHLRGKSFRYEATYPDGTQEVLLNVPHYDFGWQTNYRFTEPKIMPSGTRLDCYAHFDNSHRQPEQPEPESVSRFGDQTFEEMMIGFFEATPLHEDRQHPEKAAPQPSRLDEFNVILSATKGKPDDNIRFGAMIALLDPQIFAQYGAILRTMVPQLDRLCITAVRDGKIVEQFGPSSMRHHGPSQHEKPQDGNADAKPSAREAELAAAEKLLAERFGLLAKLPETDAAGESLAEIAAGKDVVVFGDLTKAKGKLMETMVKRGARSSMHVPAKIKGVPVTVNFWSSDPDAFTPPAQTLLTSLAKSMTTPMMFGDSQAGSQVNAATRSISTTSTARVAAHAAAPRAFFCAGESGPAVEGRPNDGCKPPRSDTDYRSVTETLIAAGRSSVGLARHLNFDRQRPRPESAMMYRLKALAGFIVLALVVPTSIAAPADGPLTAGVATADITPPPGARLWGYSNRTHGATGTLDPLMAKAVVLRAGDKSVAIVSLDLGRTPEESVLAKVREKTRLACGVSDLFITASHTHHAPTLEATEDTPNAFGEKVGDQIAEIICAATQNLVPVRIGVGRGAADLSHNRRKFLPDGRVAMQWRNAEREPTEPVDREFATIRLDRADGSPLAVLFNYACHPVVLGPDNYQYSADFVGPACDARRRTAKNQVSLLARRLRQH